jgi:hypothetical protein
MKIKTLLLFLFLILGIKQTALADSPLTSTAISEAYATEKMVIAAGKTEGVLTKELMKFLNSKSSPIAVKIAVINKLGWSFEGQNNAGIFWEYLQKNNKYKDEADFLKKADADLLICFAYMKALDNYFDVNDALKIAQEAVSKDKKKSYAVNIIAALIEAQKAMDTDWCEVYKTTDKVRNEKSLVKDLNENAIFIIFEYMDLYKDHCN